MTNVISAISPIKAAVQPEPEDYVENGLLCCGICRTPREAIVPVFGKVPCFCACRTKQRDAERDARHKQEDFDRLQKIKSVGMADPKFRNATFSADDGRNSTAMSKLWRYAQKWPEMKAQNIGLLLCGGVGTGKSFGAACIGNAVMASGTAAMFTNFSRVLNQLSGFTDDRNSFINQLVAYPLLVLDDFGIERSTEYALEQVYSVIDARYRSEKPLIVTTNLSLKDLKNPADMAHRRIYDRVLEMCVPISFGTEGRRTGYSCNKAERAKELLGGDDNV